MTPGPLSPGRRRASDALLLIGYPLAVGAAAKLVPMYRQRRFRRFLTLEAGTASVVAGLALRRRRVPALVNAGALAAFAGAWMLGGRRSPNRSITVGDATPR